MGTLRLGGDPIALAPGTVRCAECDGVVGEDEAQAVRWGYWAEGLVDVYPYCLACAEREFAPEAPRGRDRAQSRAKDASPAVAEQQPI